LSIQDIQEWLSWVLDDDIVDAIESHRRALLSEVRRIEGVATQEAQTRGWDLNVIGDLMQGMLRSARSTLRDADRVLKAAHHAARVEDPADEASEVLDGMRWWSRQDCTEFRKELDYRNSTGSCRSSARRTPSLSCPAC
jgi:Mg2+ and Co2+ transporter CorA